MKPSSLSMILFFVVFTFSSCLPMPTLNRNNDYVVPSIRDQVEEVSPAIVSVDCISPDSLLLLMFIEKLDLSITPEIAKEIKMTHGTGFIISKNGYILTNSHVVPKGWIVEVTLKDGQKFKTTEVVHDEIGDIALIKIKAKNLPFVSLSREEPESGDFIFAVTRPMSWDWSVKIGVISHPYREVWKGIFNMQMTLPVNPGDSGSPVFNYNGEVVGIARAYIINANLITLACPWKRVKSSIVKLKKDLEKIKEYRKEIKSLLPRIGQEPEDQVGDFYDYNRLLSNEQYTLDSLG